MRRSDGLPRSCVATGVVLSALFLLSCAGSEDGAIFGTGGSPGSGVTAATGGVTGSGGVPATGGTTGSGGSVGSGGNGTGGTGTGGTATGGVTGSGGRGGTTGTGGAAGYLGTGGAGLGGRGGGGGSSARGGSGGSGTGGTAGTPGTGGHDRHRRRQRDHRVAQEVRRQHRPARPGPLGLHHVLGPDHPENAGKWGSVEADARPDELDRARHHAQLRQGPQHPLQAAQLRLGQPAAELDRRPVAGRAEGGGRGVDPPLLRALSRTRS